MFFKLFNILYLAVVKNAVNAISLSLYIKQLCSTNESAENEIFQSLLQSTITNFFFS